MLARRLAEVDRFVDAATVVCEETKRIGALSTVVLLHLASGPPVLAIDNVPGRDDERRLYAVSEHNWQHNPVFRTMREHLGPLAIDPNELVLPLVGSQGWFGTILVRSAAPASVQRERDLAMVATHLSVWCTRRGIGAVPDLPARERLGPRQHRVAELAARGQTNDEIGAALHISINTVKGRLKEVFERLGVRNRTELVNVLARLAPRDEVAPGITRLPTVTVTRALHSRKR